MEERNTFLYNLREGWRVIESPYDSVAETEFPAILVALGYNSWPTFSVGESESFSVEWYRPSSAG